MEDRKTFLERETKRETARLNRVFNKIEDANVRNVAKPLIEQLGRLKALCDWLWLDIQENGNYSYFTQSEKTEPFEKERPSAKQYATYAKLHSSVANQLIALCPKAEKKEVAKQVSLKGMLKK